MADKSEDSDLPQEENQINDQGQNLASSGTGKDISFSRMRNVRNTERERLADQKLAEMHSDSLFSGISAISKFFDAPKPYDPNFNLDKLKTDPKYKFYRDMDDQDKSEATGRGRHLSKTVKLTVASGATIALGAITAVEIGQRQKEFHSVLPDVEAATGVPSRLIGAFWGNESGFGKNLVSPTNCLGDGQFTRATWAGTILQYGDRIPGMEKFAEDLRSGKIKPNDPELQKMRLNTKVSAYAMGFYINEVARNLDVDPKDENNWHKIYAGYTVGPGNARKLINNKDNDVNATEMLGDVARHNPMFYNKGRATPGQALKNYDAVIMRSAKAFDTQIVAKMENAPAANDPVFASAEPAAVSEPVAKAPKAPEPISVANEVDGAVIKASAKPAQEFGDPKAKAEAEKDKLASMTIVDKIKARMTSFAYGYDEAKSDQVLVKPIADGKPRAPISLSYGEPVVVAEKNRPADNVPMYNLVG